MPIHIQKKAVLELRQISDNDLVLLAKQSDICEKSCWENASLVLQWVGFPRIKNVIPFLMEWFQDVNWPGVLNILELLKTVNSEYLVPYVESASLQAIEDKDEGWAFGLLFLIDELKMSKTLFGTNIIKNLEDLVEE